MINVALPKGRLGEKVYAMFEAAGYECPSIKENSRKLIFENPECGTKVKSGLGSPMMVRSSSSIYPLPLRSRYLMLPGPLSDPEEKPGPTSFS